MEDADATRELLKKEQRQLAQELEQILLAYRERLEHFARNEANMDEAAFHREVDVLREKQHHLRRAIKRAGLVERETQELLREWGDWEQAASAGAPLDRLARERREMVRSELAVRGQEKESRSDSPREEIAAPAEEVPLRFETSMVARDEDALEEWDQILEQILAKESDDAVCENACDQHLEIIRRFRMTEAERKRLDRAKGIRRDRIAAFPF